MTTGHGRGTREIFPHLRAYVAPDGAPADHSTNNVPYKPKRFLKVNPAGVDENDAVFILGYPGRTFRHRTASYLAYEERFRMPFIADLFQWQISTMEQLGKNDRAIALKHDARIKGLANTSKNYRGANCRDWHWLQLVAAKEAEERLLQEYIEKDPVRKATYASVLAEINSVYQEMSVAASSELVLDAVRSSSTLLSIAFTLSDAIRELQKPEAERLPAYLDRNIPGLKEITQSLKNYYEPTDRAFLTKLFSLAAALPSEQRIVALDEAVQNDYSDASVRRFLDSAFARTKLADPAFLVEALTQSPEQLEALNDRFVALAKRIAPALQQLRNIRQRREGALSKNSALLVDIKSQYQQTSFIPDANSTMRFTYGRIKGYSPADAVHYSPLRHCAAFSKRRKKNFPTRRRSGSVNLRRTRTSADSSIRS
ncbi:MAG: S46 family peptidase [Desulfobacterales bacterium]|nr:S46 family peptidase [Desulfobacterales bacterium]